MTAEELLAKRDALEVELAEVNRLLTFADCPGEGRCHGCASWCDNCGDVGTMCDAIHCDRHSCSEPGCRKSVEDGDHIIDGWGYCPEHVEGNR